MIDDFRVKIFADGADLTSIRELAENPLIRGFTTNPSLMRKAGVEDYREFAREVLTLVGDRPISFEVFSDDFEEMHEQAVEIASWGKNVYVKIPVTNTSGASSESLITDLARRRIPLNVTAVFTIEQVKVVGYALGLGIGPAVVSVFAGRIADAGQDPLVHMKACRYHLQNLCPRAELLWASSRQVYDVVQADLAGCQIISVTPELLAKLSLLGTSLVDYSLSTVKMFHDDATASGYEISAGDDA